VHKLCVIFFLHTVNVATSRKFTEKSKCIRVDSICWLLVKVMLVVSSIWQVFSSTEQLVCLVSVAISETLHNLSCCERCKIVFSFKVFNKMCRVRYMCISTLLPLLLLIGKLLTPKIRLDEEMKSWCIYYSWESIGFVTRTVWSLFFTSVAA